MPNFQKIMRLRAPNISDIDALMLWENDPNVQQHSSEPQNFSRKEIAEFIARNDNLIENSQQRLMIVDHQNTAVGCVDLYNFCAKTKKAFVGILVYQNKQQGIGLKALNTLALYTKNVYHLKELQAEISKENIAAQKLFSKAGYKKIETKLETEIYQLKL